MKLRFEYPAPVIVKLKYRKRGAVTDWYASHHDKRKRASFGLSFPSAPRLPKREPMEAGDFGSIVTEEAGTAKKESDKGSDVAIMSSKSVAVPA